MRETAERGIVNILALLLLVAGLVVGIYLVQHPTIFKPKAAVEGTRIEVVDSSGNPITATSSQDVKVKLTYVAPSPSPSPSPSPTSSPSPSPDIGLRFGNTNQISIGLGLGNSIGLFDVVSTGATSYQLELSQNIIGVSLSPSSGSISNNETVHINISVGSNAIAGNYNVNIILKNPASGQQITRSLSLTVESKGTISTTVYYGTSSGNSPYYQARVKVKNLSSQLIASCTTNPAGRCDVVVDPGTYDVYSLPPTPNSLCGEIRRVSVVAGGFTNAGGTVSNSKTPCINEPDTQVLGVSSFPTAFRVTNDQTGLNSATEQTFNSNGKIVDWKLSDGAGAKTVYAQFKVDNVWGSVLSTTISYNPPSSPSPTLTPSPSIAVKPQPVSGTPIATCPTPGTQATFNWNRSDGVTLYKLRINDESNGWLNSCTNFNPGDSCANVNSPSYTFTPLTGHTYAWWIHACNDDGCSISTGGKKFTCPDSVPQPVASSSLSATCSAPGTVATLNWGVVNGATLYKLRINDESNGWLNSCTNFNPGDSCANFVGTTTVYNFNSKPGASYGWWIHACNNTGCSAPTYGTASCKIP